MSNSETTISDGCTEWTKCQHPLCDLQVVRPGKVQCSDWCDYADDDSDMCSMPHVEKLIDEIKYLHDTGGETRGDPDDFSSGYDLGHEGGFNEGVEAGRREGYLRGEAERIALATANGELRSQLREAMRGDVGRWRAAVRAAIREGASRDR